MAQALLYPTSLSDANANVATGAITDIDDGITGDSVTMDSVQNQWTGFSAGTANSAFSLGITDSPTNYDTFTSVVLKVRARVLAPAGSDDTTTYRVDISGTNAPADTIEFTDADVGSGFITRTFTNSAVTPSATDIDGWVVRVYQYQYSKTKGNDNLELEIDEVEVELNYVAATINRSPGKGALSLAGQAPSLKFNYVRSWDDPTEMDLNGWIPVVLVGFSISTPAGSLTLSGKVPVLAYDWVAFPAVGTMTATGQAPTLFYQYARAPPSGSVALTGQAPSVLIGVSITPAAGSATLSGAAPVAGQSYTIPVSNGSLTLAGQVPRRGAGLKLTGYAPIVDTAGTTIVPGVGSLTLAGKTPSVEFTYLVNVGAGSLSLTGQAPLSDFAISVGAGSLTLAGQAPSAELDYFVDVGAGSLTLSGKQPTVLAAFSITTPAGSLTLAGQAPSVERDYFIDVAAGSLTLTGASYVINYSIVLSEGLLTLTGAAPALGLDYTITPAAGALSLSGKIPEVLTGGKFAPPAGTLVLAGQTIVLDYAILEADGSLTLSGQAPTLRFASIRIPAAGALTLNGKQPALSIDAALATPAGSLALTGAAPTLDLSIATTDGALVLAGQAPTVLVSKTLTVPAGSLVLAGQAPVADTGNNVVRQPAKGTLTLAGKIPSAEEDHVITPAAGTLTLNGKQPALSSGLAIPTSAGSLSLSTGTPSTADGFKFFPNTGALNISVTTIPGTGTAALGSEFGYLGHSSSVFGFGTSDFTVEFWAQAPRFGLGSNEVILGKRDASGLGWEILQNGAGLIFIINDGVVNINEFVSDVLPDDEKYHHIAMSIDRTNDEMRIYIDGALTSGSPVDISTVTGSLTATSNFRIFSAGHGLTQVWGGGRIDDVRLWSDVRTASEITANKDSALTGSEAGLLAYWKMDGTPGNNITLVPDDSPNTRSLIGSGDVFPKYDDSTGLSTTAPADTAPTVFIEMYAAVGAGGVVLAGQDLTLALNDSRVAKPPVGALTITVGGAPRLSYKIVLRDGARTRLISLTRKNKLKWLYD